MKQIFDGDIIRLGVNPEFYVVAVMPLEEGRDRLVKLVPYDEAVKAYEAQRGEPKEAAEPHQGSPYVINLVCGDLVAFGKTSDIYAVDRLSTDHTGKPVVLLRVYHAARGAEPVKPPAIPQEGDNDG